MILPAELLQAVSASGGGKITLVVGAGCSFEAPTAIPLAGVWSQECHDRLVANGVLAVGDCVTPSNLSSLADAVVEKTGKQRFLVEQLLEHYELKAASPNEGHLLTAALLREGAIASVVTLNFDLALSTAIAQLGVGDAVGIIDSPDDLQNQKVINLYYLHRNANAADLEAWILRSDAIKSEWKGKWQDVVAARVLATPIVVFVGLGSPADVLIESTKLIQSAIPDGSKAFQIDPGEPGKSEFFKELALDRRAFVQGTWCDFMAALSDRLVVEHTVHLKTAADQIVLRDELPPEDLNAFLNRLKDIGLVDVGRLRASWLLHDKPYFAEDLLSHELIAGLLLAAAFIARVTGTTALLFANGIVEFKRGDRTVATHVFASGRGSRSRTAIESELSRHRRFRGLTTQPSGAIVAGISDNGAAQITPPVDVLVGDTSGSIVLGASALPIFLVGSLRQDPTRCKQVAP